MIKLTQEQKTFMLTEVDYFGEDKEEFEDKEFAIALPYENGETLISNVEDLPYTVVEVTSDGCIEWDVISLSFLRQIMDKNFRR